MAEEVELSEVVTILGAMPEASPVSSVAQIRERIASLGPRPDFEQVEAARNSLAAIDFALAEALERILFAKQPADAPFAQWKASQEEEERVARESAEQEKLDLRALLQLDELHELYGKLLHEAESVMEHGETTHVQRDLPEQDQLDVSMAVKILSEALEKGGSELILRRHSLQHIPEVIGRMSSLTVLDLSDNQIKVLPDAISGLVNLVKLEVQSNKLQCLPDSIGLLAGLKFLNASRNQLKTLPSSMTGCSGLVELIVEFNNLEHLPLHFGTGFDSLEKLSLQINNLSRLPESLCEAKNLKHLDVRFNKLKSLPKSIGKLTDLQFLDASRNFYDLASLPESMGDLASLVCLDVSFNQIRELPLSLGRLTKLTTLKVEENPLVDPPPEVVQRGAEATVSYLAERWQTSLLNEAAAAAAQDQSVLGWLSGFYSNISGYLSSSDGKNKNDFLEQQF